jgi:hypothetical protein
MSQNLTQTDLQRISTVVEKIVDDRVAPVEKKIDGLVENVGSLTTSVDGFSRTVRRHEDEWLVLRAQHEKMRNVLVKKGVASEDELSIS